MGGSVYWLDGFDHSTILLQSFGSHERGRSQLQLNA